MRKVVVTTTGKVDGIPHLFCSRGGRFYVRYKNGPVDKTAPLEDVPESPTFSWLQRASDKAFKKLKKAVDSSAQGTEANKLKPPSVSGQSLLAQTIDTVWTNRGVSASRLRELQKACAGLAITSSRQASVIKSVNDHNQRVIEENYNSLPNNGVKKRALDGITTVFTTLIARGLHTGKVPALDVAFKIEPSPRQNHEIDFDGAVKIIKAIRADSTLKPVIRLELELYTRLAIETGQRPIDLYLLDISKIDSTGHYEFLSHKTGRYQRVLHLLSSDSLRLIKKISEMRGIDHYTHKWDKHHRSSGESFESFWSKSFSVYVHNLADFTKEALGQDAIFYGLKDFFISQIFRATQNEFWAKVFTHEGRGANQKSYLFLDQEKADKVLGEAILMPFARAMLKAESDDDDGDLQHHTHEAMAKNFFKTAQKVIQELAKNEDL